MLAPVDGLHMHAKREGVGQRRTYSPGPQCLEASSDSKLAITLFVCDEAKHC